MKAADFAYARPETLEAALALLNDTEIDSAVLAGGQSLMPMMNFRLAAPERLIDLNRIDGLAGITEDGDHLRIGAMTRYAALMADPLVAAHVPLFGRALPHVAHPAIRARGTIGGSVALADPAAEMPALLLALGGAVELTGPDGVRKVAADDFFVGLFETAREPGELVTAIEVPKARADQRFGFYELARRHGDYAVSGVALMLTGAQKVESARVAYFSVADRAVRAGLVEAALAGLALDELPGALGEPDLSDIGFAGDLNADEATKSHLSRVVLKRALAEVFP